MGQYDGKIGGMTDVKRTYRHKVSGRVGEYDPRVALADPNLVEVPAGAKPLAYTPIPQEAVEAHLALQEAEEKAPAPAPVNKRSK